MQEISGNLFGGSSKSIVYGYNNMPSSGLVVNRRHTCGDFLLRNYVDHWQQLCEPRLTMTERRSTLKHKPLSKKLKATATAVLRPHSTGPRPSTQGTPKSQQSPGPRPSIQMVQRTQSSAKQWRSSRAKKLAAGKDPDKESPIEIFKRTAKAVRVISGICLIIKRYAQRGVQMEWETIQANLKLFAEFDSMMAFSLDNQDLSIRPVVSERMQRILDKKPDDRTVKEIQSVQWLLKENDAFQGYPLDTQVELCKCMNYQRYEARRIILRQSHPSDGFYIIMSGSVMLNIYEKDKPIVKEVAAGCSFGEMELERDIDRVSTVVCKTDVELMVIFKEDFEKIIKGPQLQQKERHIDYLRGLPLFEHFPVEKLRVSTDEFYHKYYKKGKVIVPCANDNEHVIIVQSGNCQIICEIYTQKQRPQSAHTGCPVMEEHFPALHHREKVKDRAKRAKSATLLQWETGEMRNDMRSNVLTGSAKPEKILKREDTKRFNSLSGSAHTKVRGGHKKYVSIGNLEKGSVFGLESMFKDYPTKIVLLSEGAECIFISRKLFIKESNPRVLQTVSQMLVTYPTEEYLCTKLEEERKWNKYKQSLVTQISRRNRPWSAADR